MQFPSHSRPTTRRKKSRVDGRKMCVQGKKFSTLAQLSIGKSLFFRAQKFSTSTQKRFCFDSNRHWHRISCSFINRFLQFFVTRAQFTSRCLQRFSLITTRSGLMLLRFGARLSLFPLEKQTKTSNFSQQKFTRPVA